MSFIFIMIVLNLFPGRYESRSFIIDWFLIDLRGGEANVLRLVYRLPGDCITEFPPDNYAYVAAYFSDIDTSLFAFGPKVLSPINDISVWSRSFYLLGLASSSTIYGSAICGITFDYLMSSNYPITIKAK